MEQGVLKLAKLTTALSGALTVLCALLVAGMQVASGMRDGVWNAYTLAWVADSLKGGRRATYVTASANTTGQPALIDWVLGISIVVPLVIVVLIHIVLYFYLLAIEQRISPPAQRN